MIETYGHNKNMLGVSLENEVEEIESKYGISSGRRNADDGIQPLDDVHYCVVLCCCCSGGGAAEMDLAEEVIL